MEINSIAIVGAGLAGVRCSETLREHGYDGRLALVGAEAHLPYDRPPLSKRLLTGEESAADILLREESYYAELDIDLLLGRHVTALRPSTSTIELDGGPALKADRVILCTGGFARHLPIPGMDLDGVHVLRTLDDAQAIRADITPGARVAVIGAGFIGTEVAASARSIGCEVSIFEMADRPLARMLPEAICLRYADEHRRHGVTFHLGSSVTEFVGQHRVVKVRTGDGREHQTDLVVVGAGIVPDTRLAEEAGLSVSDGVMVDEFCATSNPAIYAAGDVTRYRTRSGTVRAENWQNASDQGAAAALSIIGQGEPYGDGVYWFWSDQYDLNLQMAGHVALDCDVVWRGDLESDNFCAFYLSAGVLTGAIAANRPKDVRSAMRLIERGIMPSREVLADPNVDLRGLTSVR